MKMSEIDRALEDDGLIMEPDFLQLWREEE
jgi:hypothetical protein